MSGKVSRALVFLLCFLICAALAPLAFAEDDAAPVKVLFSSEDESALPGLRVFDEAGVEYAPLTDAGSGEIQYGSFLIPPGEYSYAFHDDSGRYEDFSAFFTVEEAIKYIIPVDLTPVIEIQSFSFTYIDPIYEGIITEADIPDVSAEQAAAAEEALRELATVQANNPRRLRAKQYWNENVYYDNDEEAALFLRSQIETFQDTAMLGICSNVKLNNSTASQKFTNIWSITIAHTGAPTKGDYLRYEYGGYKVEIKKIDEAYIGSEDGLYYYKVPYSFIHYTNADQEAELTPIVDNILEQLDLQDKNDLQKILSIYDYLCANVTYDRVSDGNLKRTAYAALINHTAVCQGYAAAFYRLCLSVDVDTRMITSKSMGHAWNIAALGGQYYELDATWDSDANRTLENYKYFLKGSEYWLSSNPKHSTIGDQFDNDASFAAAYPLSVSDVPILRFDSDGGSAVLPQYVLSGDQANMPAAPTKDGYWFTGWYSDSSFETMFDFDTAVDADTTLYARWEVPDLVLPAALTEIEDEAFRGGAFSFVQLPEQAVSVGSYAFTDCTHLAFVYIPENTSAIDPDAFHGITALTILGFALSPAETYADTYGFAFVPLDNTP